MLSTAVTLLVSTLVHLMTKKRQEEQHKPLLHLEVQGSPSHHLHSQFPTGADALRPQGSGMVSDLPTGPGVVRTHGVKKKQILYREAGLNLQGHKETRPQVLFSSLWRTQRDFLSNRQNIFFPPKHKILQLSKLQPKAWLLLFLKSRSGSRGQRSFPHRSPLRIISETAAGRMTMHWAVRGEDPSKDRKAKMRVPAKY